MRASDAISPVDGIVSDDIAEVWVEISTGQRLATSLMSLGQAGLDGSAFVGFVPAGSTARNVVALDAGGNELETFHLP